MGEYKIRPYRKGEHKVRPDRSRCTIVSWGELPVASDPSVRRNPRCRCGRYDRRMDPFPPGFPFVSRTPDPAPEPETTAAPDPVAPEAASEPAPAAAEPQTPTFWWRRSADADTAGPDSQPAAEREPWHFRRRETEPVVAAESAAAPDPAPHRGPWPFPRRNTASTPVVESDAPPQSPEREPWPFPRRNREAEAIASEPSVTAASTAPNVQTVASTSELPPAQNIRPAQEPRKAVPAARPVVKNERRKTRRDALSTAALLRVDGVHGPPLKIELSDISIAGARFRSPQKLDLGEKAQVRVEVGPFRWTTRLRVVHCEPLDDGAASIGCAFLRTELLRPWPVAA